MYCRTVDSSCHDEKWYTHEKDRQTVEKVENHLRVDVVTVSQPEHFCPEYQYLYEQKRFQMASFNKDEEVGNSRPV